MEVGTVEARYYTHALWKVKSGKEAEFIEAWKGLGTAFSNLPSKPSTHGTLIQSLADPTEFYSFGPWNSLEEIQEMRANPDAQAAFGRVVELCDQATPGGYRVVAEIRL